MNIKNDWQFNIHPPHIGLSHYILYYNVVFPKCGMFAQNYTLMPDACGTLSLAFDGTAIAAELWGASVTPTLLGVEPNGYQVLLLIQLSPYGLYQITRQSQIEFADKRLSLEDIDNALFRALLRAFEIAESVFELVNACDKILHKRIEQNIVSNALFLSTKSISNSHGQIQVKEVARQTGYSERQLNRLFITQIGMSVKSYARLTRFNYVLKHIQKSPCFFTALSQQAGYFDQAHFDKDFKSISSVTPKSYLEKMSDFYYDPTEIFAKLSLKEE